MINTSWIGPLINTQVSFILVPKDYAVQIRYLSVSALPPSSSDPLIASETSYGFMIVSIPSLQVGTYFWYRLINVNPSASDIKLSSLPDVNVIEGPSIDQQFLKWDNATFKWVAGIQYKVDFFFKTTPLTSEILLLHVASNAFTLAVNFANSQGYIGTNPAASFTMTVFKNGISIGTIVVNTSGAITFTKTSATSFIAGDVIKITGPSTIDTTITNCAFTLVGS